MKAKDLMLRIQDGGFENIAFLLREFGMQSDRKTPLILAEAIRRGMPISKLPKDQPGIPFCPYGMDKEDLALYKTIVRAGKGEEFLRHIQGFHGWTLSMYDVYDYVVDRIGKDLPRARNVLVNSPSALEAKVEAEERRRLFEEFMTSLTKKVKSEGALAFKYFCCKGGTPDCPYLKISGLYEISSEFIGALRNVAKTRGILSCIDIIPLIMAPMFYEDREGRDMVSAAVREQSGLLRAIDNAHSADDSLCQLSGNDYFHLALSAACNPEFDPRRDLNKERIASGNLRITVYVPGGSISDSVSHEEALNMIFGVSNMARNGGVTPDYVPVTGFLKSFLNIANSGGKTGERKLQTGGR